MEPYYLYKITNLVNEKVYIGITNDPVRRMHQHFNKRIHSSISIIKQAIDKYGKESFKFEVLCIGDKAYILELESKAIKAYRTQEKPFGYNIKPGGDSGRGYAIKVSKRDTPQYASGFWFPNVRTAATKLGVSKTVIKSRRKNGVLGDLVLNHLLEYPLFPAYVGGFWWDNIRRASCVLGVSLTTLRSRVFRDSREEAFKVHNQSGELGNMYGVLPADHPSSKSVLICGELFTSIKEATAATGHSKYIITQRIKESHPDFSFVNEEHHERHPDRELLS